MKKTLLVGACVFTASIAMAGDSAKHRQSRTTTTSEHTTSLTGRGADQEHTRIDDMNQYRYSKTFGVHGLRGSEPANADASDRYNPNWGRQTTATTTTTTTSETGSSAEHDSAEMHTEEMDESTSLTGAGTKSSDNDQEASEATTGNKAGDRETADAQAEKSERDLEITRQIRQEIMKNDNLSVRAQNLNITTDNGRVSIRGTVNSNAEKTSVEQIARGVSGVSSVNNQITVSR